MFTCVFAGEGVFYLMRHFTYAVKVFVKFIESPEDTQAVFMLGMFQGIQGMDSQGWTCCG